MEANTIMTFLTDAVEVVTSAVGSVWTLATSNPLIAFGVGVAILGTGIGIFSALRQNV